MRPNGSIPGSTPSSSSITRPKRRGRPRWFARIMRSRECGKEMAAGRLNFLRRPTLWALLALFAAEFTLFDQVGARNHSWIYPRWNDQVQYLTECYKGWEFLRAHGFWRGIAETLLN